MTDRSTFDAFEQRLARDLARYVQPAVDPMAPTDIADAAMQPRGAVARVRNTSTRRRLLLLGVAAVLLIPAAFVGTGGIRPAPAVGPWTAVYARSSAGSVDIITLAPDGSQHLVRSVPTSGPGALDVAAAGLVSRTGMTFLYWQGYESSDGPIAVFDLGQPSRPPLLEQMGAPIGPRWSATGLLAVPGLNPSACTSMGPECWAVITILDPATGGTRRIGQLGLFGGGPSIVWTLDSSGIWDGGQLRPVEGGADVPIAPNQLFIDRGVGAGGQAAGDGGIFASDGRARLTISDEVVSGRHVAVVRRTDQQGTAAVLARWPLPDGASGPWLTEPDPSDAAFPISYSTGPSGSPTLVEGPILYANGTVRQVGGGFFMGWAPASLAASWAR